MRVGMGDSFSGMESLLSRRRALLRNHFRACRVPKRGITGGCFQLRKELTINAARSAADPRQGLQKF